MAKAGKGTMAITVEPVEFRNLIRLLGSLPKESQQEVRDRALPLSQRFAGQLLQFAQASRTPVAVNVAESLVAKRDRLIRVDVGGTKKSRPEIRWRKTQRRHSRQARSSGCRRIALGF